ncbi:tripartite tricarboxylate transporter substrate-binding protein [Variovorax sp. J31P179]|nr:tripartite tricarboxylate transporter substrate-binding protein [Variovorax sp. J31P179]MDM0084607.1 tripartite tricarboxylate transporter substrate-binding protein [Variovorax sp. J31P179]
MAHDARACYLAFQPSLRLRGAIRDSEVWLSLAAPAGTPPAVIKRICADVVSVLKEPAVREKLAEQGLVRRFQRTLLHHKDYRNNAKLSDLTEVAPHNERRIRQQYWVDRHGVVGSD